MKLKTDEFNRIFLVDDFKPYGAIAFQKHKDGTASVYQTAEDEVTKHAFENLYESAEFSREEIIEGLQKVIDFFKENE